MMSDVDSAALDHVGWLRTRWSERFAKMPEVGPAVIERYDDPGRAYHDMRHLAEVLEHIDTLVGECHDHVAVELAAWFHDAVYDVRRGDNEAASAKLARTLLAPWLPAEQVDEVARLVLLTRDHQVDAGDSDGAVLCDADLAILASGPAEYSDYANRVRREYTHVSDDAFRAGRAVVLRALLDLPALFHTPHGVVHWQAKARANLQAELATLSP